ncbi:MAG: extracellular solute-binding protein [Clostridia bacterium]
MRKHVSIFIIFIFLFNMFLTGCNNHSFINPDNPITLTLWHNYGGQMKNTMDEMIDEFNATIGTEKGIIVNVTSISGSATLHEKLAMAANGDPGAPSLPDITTAYPKTALILAEKELLVDLNEQFTAEELSAYIPRFLEEGKLKENKLYVFPTAKSTEVLFLNATIFNKFATATGAKLETLKTFEGIKKVAQAYYDWTDSQTPDIENDGKTFYIPDSLFNFSQVAYKQLGDNFIKDGGINFSSPHFPKIWEHFYEPAVLGHMAIFDGYASDLAKTGDIVCSTGSTAGVLFFSPTVTYADNTSEPAELVILPYPVFEGGKKVSIQRGGGMCVIKSTKQKEYLAGIFLKWFTSPENNLRFVSSTGYLPVTDEAFGEIMSKEIGNVSDKNIKNLLYIAREMQKEYDFYIPPLFEEIDELQTQYQNELKKVASESKDKYYNLLKIYDKKAAFENASKGVYENFIK